MEKQLAQYTLIREIGCGAMSTVYQALDTRLGRMVALKLLLAPTVPSTDQQHRYIQRLRREATLIAQLSHPNVVTIHDVGEHAGQHFIVMEYLSGISLRAHMDQKRLSLAEVSRILDQVADALDAVHAQEIVHRDIKPSNIVLLPDGQVKLLDFGVARQSDGATLTQTGLLIGSPAYMSPEQARGDTATPASDLWAIGVLLYEMLAGRPPFSGTNISSVLYQVVHEQPAPLAGWHVSVQKIVQRALQKDPAKRYRCARELAEAVRRVLHVPEAPLSRQRHWKAGAASVLLAGVLGAGVVALSPLPGKERQGPKGALALVQPRTMSPSPTATPAEKPPVIIRQVSPPSPQPAVPPLPKRLARTARPPARLPDSPRRKPKSTTRIVVAKSTNARDTIPAAPRESNKPLRPLLKAASAASPHRTKPGKPLPARALRVASIKRVPAPSAERRQGGRPKTVVTPSLPASAAPQASRPPAPRPARGQTRGPDKKRLPGKSNLRGTWRGNIWKHPAILVIRHQEGSSFTGTVAVKTEGGTARLAIAGEVSRETGQIRFWATHTLTNSELPDWDVGRERGRVLTRNLMGGLGQDSRNRVYTWSFSRP